jgi:hypothetical protein
MNFKNFYKPTPKKWRKIGDAILASATFITVGGLFGYDQLKEVFGVVVLRAIIGTSLALGVTGKFLTNFFKDDKDENKTDTQDNN